jgi:outer membrane protein OmpA-like peptidoglycan-associated protein
MKNFLVWFVVLAFCCITSFAANGQDRAFSDVVGPVKINDVQKNGPIQVPFIFWGGDVVTFHANGGLKTANGSIYQKQGLNLNLIQEDDFVQQVRDYMSGKSPFLRGTTDMIARASDVIGSDPRTKPVMIMQITWSKGDHLVVKTGIKTLADLKGRTIALQEFGPHVKLLDDVLKVANLTWDDVKIVYTKDLTGDTDSPVGIFKRRQDVDAAFVVTPDMIALTGGLQNVGSGAEGTIKGARVVASTSELSRSIADVYVCRKDFFDSNQDVVTKFVAGYFKASEEVMEMQTAYNSKGSKPYLAVLKMSQDIFGKKLLPTLEEDAAGLVADAVFVGYPGNVVFFTEENNANGFDAVSKDVIGLSLSRGHIRNRFAFFSPNFDYQSSFFVGYLASVKVNREERFRGEALQQEIEALTNSGGLDSNTLVSFSIQFSPNQVEFNADTYGNEFQRVIDVLSKAGNAVIAVRGHSDPTKTLSDFVKAGTAKGTLRQSGTTGNFSYYLDGKAFDLSDTKSVINAIDNGVVDGSPNGINPRDTMQSALNLSRQRAEAVRKAIIDYAAKQNIRIDPSQIQPSGVGVKEPLISKPRNAGEAGQNMRVEFRLVRVTAEPTKQGDFDF